MQKNFSSDRVTFVRICFSVHASYARYGAKQGGMREHLEVVRCGANIYLEGAYGGKVRLDSLGYKAMCCKLGNPKGKCKQ